MAHLRSSAALPSSRSCLAAYTHICQSARTMSIDKANGVPKAEFRRPSGIEWKDNDGEQHFTQATKTRMAIFTGNPDDRIPVDPYAPDVTPSQMKKLSESEKQKVSAFSQKLKQMNAKAYEGINVAVAKQQELAKDIEEASTFMSILRRWNSDAYKNVDTELQEALADKKSRLEMAKKLREWNPTAYKNVDAEIVDKARPTSEFRRPKGIEWYDNSGQAHFTKMAKSKATVHTGDSKELPPPDSGGFAG